jgi:hypothetical protein
MASLLRWIRGGTDETTTTLDTLKEILAALEDNDTTAAIISTKAAIEKLGGTVEPKYETSETTYKRQD